MVVDAVKRSGWIDDISCVVSGTAKGVDKLGEKFALDYGLKIDRYPARWDIYGKQAGYIRNIEMAGVSDALIAVWDGVSKGTAHMIEQAHLLDLQVFVCYIK